jgi:hypothetical protein
VQRRGIDDACLDLLEFATSSRPVARISGVVDALARILGGEDATAVELDAVTNMQRERARIVREGPGLGEARNRLFRPSRLTSGSNTAQAKTN